MYIYDHTHFCVHVRPKKQTNKNGTLAIQTFGVTDLI